MTLVHTAVYLHTSEDRTWAEQLFEQGFTEIFIDENGENEAVHDGYQFRTESCTATLHFFNLPCATIEEAEKFLGLSPGRLFELKIDTSIPSYQPVTLTNGYTLSYPPFTQEKAEKEIRLDPQGNFGTGLHPTTVHCLKTMLNDPPDGEQVADIGTGSGVLAVAAAASRALHVSTFDIEPVKREVDWQFNINQLKTLPEVYEADVFSLLPFETKFTYIVINIGAEVTLKLLPKLSLQNVNTLIISGIISWRREDVLNMCKSVGFSVAEEQQADQWHTLKLKKIEKKRCEF
ncbi:[LSU ribosomal protein L11P]-lysine N-methyltransferase [Salsuginibacillus halophilus]|uniref:[LSU ribosomal protein L11P]-lysine N-methyltransferase n=1 Tax=Salsuginibacillus halophilus TaxID=517424 RepID=A0A2P8HXH6_9BACI|nr:50S ribosomal protein L11 methyltransferase [Salsuginibacillus halophilus]PSL50884.1 [LSU ribosomal protein L11P]-lysine N-methyltransferase [Salsuginibacillus halophilus]